MRTMKKITIVLLSVLFLAACSPGTYTGGNWTSAPGPSESRASFGFSVEDCDTDTKGHFSLSDEDWEVPVEISGHVMDFGGLGEFRDDCAFYALLEYVSANPDHPGEGHAVVCFGNEKELQESGESGDIWVTVQSGPYEGYENFGPIFGNVQSHECDT